jgi:Protein of unknown function (DUF1566)/Collagen triple helix repeat (20 copies)
MGNYMTTKKIVFAPWCAIFMGLFISAAMAAPAAAAISIAVTNFRGNWDPTVNYGAGAIVTYNGQSYIAIVKNTNVAPTETDAWATLDAAGPQGPKGATGATGATGTTGAAGPAGPSGPLGPPGPVGPAGSQGPAGATGVTGSAGATGATGAPGAPGPKGPVGPAGSGGLPTGCGATTWSGTSVPVVVDPAVFYTPSGGTGTGTWTCRSQLPRYVANGDGTVTDNESGLMWEIETSTSCAGVVTCTTSQYTWSSSGTLADGTLFTTFIAGLNGGDYYSPSAGQDVSTGAGSCFANHCDWRIPTLVELQTIVESTAPGCQTSAPCIDPIFGPTAPLNQSAYWTNSTYSAGTAGAYLVYFLNGAVLTDNKTQGGFARAVRSIR